MKTFKNQKYLGTIVNREKDSSAMSFQNDRDVEVTNCVVDAGTAEWGLKMSKCFNMKFKNCTFKNGTERAFDAVRGGSFIFEDCNFVNDNGSRAVTKSVFSTKRTCDIGMKGGVRDVTFINCSMNDVLLGDYTIYDQIDRPPVRRIKFIDCCNQYGGPVLVRGYHVDKHSITFEDTPHEVFFYWKWIKKLYWAYNRRFGDKRILNDQQFIITDDEKI